MYTPNFNNILKVLDKKVPDAPTLFEFFMNVPLYERITGMKNSTDPIENNKMIINAFLGMGYDYATIHINGIGFPAKEQEHKDTISLNKGFIITDRESFDNYKWREPDTDGDYDMLNDIADILPDGMKAIVPGPGGVLENVIRLVGYDNLCFMLYDDPKLIKDVFDGVGSRLLRHYELASKYECVGALISNDDWGFKTQPMMSVKQMREYVFPWHKKIVKAIHDSGKPAILHSCGNPEEIMDDIIYDMKYDGRHSYEDTIMPVEDFYDKYKGKIAVLGGMDVDFVIRHDYDEVYNRSLNMLNKSEKEGGYALGTGNSVPEYIPQDKFLTVILAAKPFLKDIIQK